MTLKTTIGQHLDFHTSQEGKPDLTKFTMKLYNAIVKYKTAYYTFQMPVSLAMLMSGIDDPEMHRQAKTILLEMGQFFQIQVNKEIVYNLCTYIKIRISIVCLIFFDNRMTSWIVLETRR